MQNTTVLRLKGGNPTTGLPSSRLLTCPRELNITLKPQHKDSRLENLMKNYSRKMITYFVLQYRFCMHYIGHILPESFTLLPCL